MVELILVSGSLAISLYALFTLGRIQKSVHELDDKLNERHDFFQVTWAEEYVKLEEKVKNIEKDIYPKL